MTDIDPMIAQLERLPNDCYVFVGDRFYSRPSDSCEYVDETEFYSTVLDRVVGYFPLSPGVLVVARDGGDTFLAGEDHGHGSAGFVARFDSAGHLVWLVSHSRNPVVRLDFVDDQTLRCVSNNEVQSELPKNISVENLAGIRLIEDPL